MPKKDMLGQVVRMLVAVPRQYMGAIADLLEKISGQESGSTWFTALGHFLNKRNPWDGKKLLLRFLYTIEVYGVTTFVAKEAFKIGTGPERDVPISFLGDNFKRDFIPKIEENVNDAVLRVHELLKISRDVPIIAELGNEEGVEITLGHYWGVLAAKHAAGDQSWIVGYIPNKNGVLCAVYSGWGHGGWRVESYPLGHPNRWTDFSHVLSCD